MDVFLVFLGVLTTWILGPFGIEVVPWLGSFKVSSLARLSMGMLMDKLRLTTKDDDDPHYL